MDIPSLRRRALLGLALGTTALAAQAQPDMDAQLKAQREAMQKLAWMAGTWEGHATTRDGNERKSISQEWIRSAAGGLAIMIQGRHYRQQADGSKGDVVLDTAGMFTYDPAAGKYHFVTQLQTGRAGTMDATFQGDTLSWRIPLASGHIRYDIQHTPQGQWSEKGYFCKEGAPECVHFFDMLLDRKGDAP